jgi:hypothetical protein
MSETDSIIRNGDTIDINIKVGNDTYHLVHFYDSQKTTPSGAPKPYPGYGYITLIKDDEYKKQIDSSTKIMGIWIVSDGGQIGTKITKSIKLKSEIMVGGTEIYITGCRAGGGYVAPDTDQGTMSSWKVTNINGDTDNLITGDININLDTNCPSNSQFWNCFNYKLYTVTLDDNSETYIPNSNGQITNNSKLNPPPDSRFSANVYLDYFGIYYSKDVPFIRSNITPYNKDELKTYFNYTPPSTDDVNKKYPVIAWAGNRLDRQFSLINGKINDKWYLDKVSGVPPAPVTTPITSVTTPPPNNPSKSNIMLYIIIALVVLCSIGFGYFYMSKGKKSKSGSRK